MQISTARDVRTVDLTYPAALPDRGNLAEYYRRRAIDCLQFAGEALDEETRNHWVRLADGWIRLARKHP
jgi:hypothetical protein